MKRTLAMAVLAAATIIAVSLWAYLSGSRTLRVRAGELTTAIKAANIGNELSGGGPHATGPDPAPVIDHAHAWAKKITLATAATGLALTALILLTTALWQQRSAGVPPASKPGVPPGRTPSAAKTTGRVGAPSPTAASTGHSANSGTSASTEAVLQQLRFELAAQSRQRRDLETQLNELKTQFDQKLEQRTAAVSAELNQRKQAEKTLSQQRQELERSKDVLELHVQARTQELQKLQRRYEHILNSAGEGIYGLDMQGKTTFLNPAAAKLTGYTVEELSGKLESQTLLRGSPQQQQTETKNQQEQTENTEKQTSASSVPSVSSCSTSLTPTTGEQTFYRKDGTTILVEYTRTPIIENNKQIGAVVTFKDITERKRAEETLARKAAELTRSNAELEQFAYVASHDLQEPLRKIRAFGDRLQTTIDQLTNNEGRAAEDTGRAAAPSGAASDSGHTQSRSDRDRRRKQEQTEKTEQQTSVPSVPSCSTSEGLSPAVASARDYLQRMQNAAARMQTLINDLLTFSRVVSTTQPFIPVDLAAVTREVLGDLEIRIQQTGAKIHVGDLPTIHADPMQMRQLLQNIIANALKFQPTGRAAAPSADAQDTGRAAAPSGAAHDTGRAAAPSAAAQDPDAANSAGGASSASPSGPHASGHVPEINITAQLLKKPFASAAEPTPDDQICELAIKDNGIGFDPKYTHKIFAMFQRLHGRAEYEGTGVGLAVCRRITDRHSGTITATSELGKGATFTIRLPVHQTNPDPVGTDPEANPGGANSTLRSAPTEDGSASPSARAEAPSTLSPRPEGPQLT